MILQLLNPPVSTTQAGTEPKPVARAAAQEAQPLGGGSLDRPSTPAAPRRLPRKTKNRRWTVWQAVASPWEGAALGSAPRRSGRTSNEREAGERAAARCRSKRFAPTCGSVPAPWLTKSHGPSCCRDHPHGRSARLPGLGGVGETRGEDDAARRVGHPTPPPRKSPARSSARATKVRDVVLPVFTLFVWCLFGAGYRLLSRHLIVPNSGGPIEPARARTVLSFGAQQRGIRCRTRSTELGASARCRRTRLPWGPSCWPRPTDLFI